MGGGVWSGSALRFEPADDGKRWLQPLDVAYPLLLVGRRSRVSGEGGSGEGVWSGPALHFEPADDGKRCVQPLDVACILFLVGRRSRVSGEGGTEEGVTGSAFQRRPLRIFFV